MPPAAATPRSCFPRRRPGLRAGGRLQSIVSTSAVRFLKERYVLIPVEANKDRLRPQPDAAPLEHGPLDLHGKSKHVARGCATAVDNRQWMLRRQADRALAVSLAHAGSLDEPGSGYFHLFAAHGKPWNTIARDRGYPFSVRPRDDRVHEKRAHAAGVRIAGVEDHALAAANRQHRVTDIRRPGLRSATTLQFGDELRVAWGR